MAGEPFPPARQGPEGTRQDTPGRGSRKNLAPVSHWDGTGRGCDPAGVATAADSLRRPGRSGVSGPDRAMHYAVAVGTGPRLNELRTLTPACFALNATPPTITVEAGYSKRRRKDVQPAYGDHSTGGPQCRTVGWRCLPAPWRWRGLSPAPSPASPHPVSAPPGRWWQ